MNNLDALRERMLDKARGQVSRALSGRDQGVARAIITLDELDRTFNSLAEQAIEWHSLHFPELAGLVQDNEAALKLMAELGDRKNFEQENLLKTVNKGLSGEIARQAKQSVGAQISEDAMRHVSALSSNALKLREHRKQLEKFVESELGEIAPNLLAIAGPMISARLIAKAGSLERLAGMPSSTIQLLGAEKALFRFIKSKKKGRPPKYGYLYAHPLVQGLPKQSKGAMARTLASKASIAAKIDFFGGERQGPKPMDSLQKRFSALRGKKPKTIKKGKKHKKHRRHVR